MEESLDIGFFTDSYFPEIDGVTYTLDSWKKRLEEKGHKVHIVYPESNNYEPGENEIPVRSFSNPFYRGYNIPLPIPRPDYPDLDIIHCHSPAFIGISGLRYAAKNNIPAIYTHHTPIEEYFEQSLKVKSLSNILEKMYVSLEHRYLKRFEVLTASTEEPRRNLKFRKLPVGIDLEFFDEVDENFFSKRDIDKPIIGYSGRISMEKNPEELLDLAETFEGTLVLIGEGPLRDEIERKKPENVITMDFIERDELPSFYSSLDVFITASTGDTLGLSTLEANACGTPVVAPEVTPFKDTINDENGFLYEKGDVEDFKQKILKAVKTDFETRKAVEKFSLSTSIETLEEMYMNIAKHKKW